jgi:uncharacterized protein
VSVENVELARRGYAAWSRGDFAASLELLHPDIEIVEAAGIPGARTYRGHEGMMQALEGVREAFDEVRFDPREFVDAGDHVAVRVRMSGRGRGSGAEVAAEIAHVWTVIDGEAVRMEMYADWGEALRAAGMRSG